MNDSGPWYVAVGSEKIGPISTSDVEARIRSRQIDRGTLCWTPGFAQWTPIGGVERFTSAFGNATASAERRARGAHDIDYTIHGSEMQFVEVELDPGECTIAEAGSMMFMTSGIGMETVFGDGNSASHGFFTKLVGAGKRLLTGESLFMTVFENRGAGKQQVAFGAPYPGKILAMDLAHLGGELICQKDSFLCAAKGVQIGIAFQKRIGVGLFGGEGFIMQRLTGDGFAFVHAGGHVHPLELKPGESLRIDTGCIVAYQPSVEFDIQYVGGIKTMLFGGEGIFFATLKGPGKVWLQSLPLSRLADRIYSAAPQNGRRKEEGSILDRAFGLGNMIDGRE